MKKAWIIAIALWSSLSASAFAADTIGYIDIDKILMTYKEAKKLQDKFEKDRLEYQKLIEKNQKRIDTAREKKKSEQEIQKILTEIDTELRPKQEELLRKEGEAQRSLLAQIMTASRVIAKENGVSVVLDKRVIYHGGFDLTDFVIDKLNR